MNEEADRLIESVARQIGELAYQRLCWLPGGTVVYCWVGASPFKAKAMLRIGHVSPGGIIFTHDGKEYSFARGHAILAHIHQSPPPE